MSAMPLTCCPSCGRAMPAGDMDIDIDRRTVSRGGTSVYLSPTHFEILEWLALSPGRPVSNDVLFEIIRTEDRPYAKGGAGVVKVTICHLREKLDPLGIHIAALWGIGYYLEFGEPGAAPVDDRRHRGARARTAPRQSDANLVTRLAANGTSPEEIATQCGLTLRAVAKAMATTSAPIGRAAA